MMEHNGSVVGLVISGLLGFKDLLIKLIPQSLYFIWTVPI